jgi:NAD(P)-dependent dehydrogenase (short-subunit alcohol dehydrogenase family)
MEMTVDMANITGLAQTGPTPGGKLRFDGLTAIVTGAGRGLGRAYALQLAALGANVLANDVGISRDAARYSALTGDAAPFGQDAQDGKVADTVASAITAAGGAARASRADVSDRDGAQSIVTDALEAFGSVDIVIHAAGIVPYAALEDTSVTDFFDALAVHIGGAFNLAKSSWSALGRSGHGRVLNIGSIEGVLVGNAGMTAYTAAKGGLWGLTQSLAVEGGPLGIHANVLLPGAITRANVSINPAAAGRSAQRSPQMTAPPAAWLVHPACTVSGRCYATDAGNVRRIYTLACRGYDSPAPERMTPEEVRNNWTRVEDTDGAIAPASMQEYNEFRQRVRAATVRF